MLMIASVDVIYQSTAMRKRKMTEQYALTFNLGRSWHLPLTRGYVLRRHTNFGVLRPYRSEDIAYFVYLR